MQIDRQSRKSHIVSDRQFRQLDGRSGHVVNSLDPVREFIQQDKIANRLEYHIFCLLII